jgi:hypothetical protein
MTCGPTPFGGGFINGALYRRPLACDGPLVSGSGMFRDLYRVYDGKPISTAPEEGYNRNGVMHALAPPGLCHSKITMGDLKEDTTGAAYVFKIDVNEQGHCDPYISLDDFRIYVGGKKDPHPLPGKFSDLHKLGSLVYGMNQSEQGVNHVLLDGSIVGHGSGAMDLFVFVPKALFVNAGVEDIKSLVYVYTKFGTYDSGDSDFDFDAQAGPEEVSLAGGVGKCFDPMVPAVMLMGDPVPEPVSSSVVFLVLVAAGGLHRRRDRCR